MNKPQPILVVDDDETIREVIRLALGDEGYDVREAANGKEALELLKDTRPGLILLDMRMPVMDGWAFSQAYRQLPQPHAPVVVLTAATDAAVFANQIKADGFLAKPFDLTNLINLVEKFAGGENL